MKIKLFILLAIFIILTPGYSLYHKLFHDYEHEFAVCAMFKNESPYLKEWIDYHHKVLHATKFYLYNNDSSDDYQNILNPYIKAGLVELIQWPSSTKENAIVGYDDDNPWYKFQIGAYTDCMKNRAIKKARWVAVLDIDEFIVPVKSATEFQNLLKSHSGYSFKYILKKLTHPFHKQKKIGCITLNWLVFGTSNVWDIQPGESLIKKLYFRAKDSHPWNNHTKCIYKPESIKICHIHRADLKSNYKVIHPKISEFRIHHYWSGPEKKLMDKRKFSSKEQVHRFSHEFNVVEDTTIFDKLEPMCIKED